MKKLIFLLITLLLSLGLLVGCMDGITDMFGSDSSDTGDNSGNNQTGNEQPAPKSEYTVTLDTNGGTPLSPMTIKAGQKCYRPYQTIRAGAEFVGWYYKGLPWDFDNYTVNSDMTLTAQWKLINYTITYDLGGGSYDGDMPESFTVESDAITFGTPTREGYEFLGWEIGGVMTNEIKKGTTKDMTVKAKWFGLEAVIMPAKGGANGIVTIIHDDARLPTMGLLDAMLEKYGLVADVGFILNKVYNNGVADMSAVASFRNYLDNGRWKIVNHSATHTWWGAEFKDNSGFSHVADDEDKREYEIVTSQAKMRELFPGQRVLTFAYPGFSTVANEYTDGSLTQLKQIIYSPTARRLIDTHHIGARFYSGGATDLDGDIDWNWMNTRFIDEKTIKGSLDSILEAAAKQGKLEILSMHGVTDDKTVSDGDPGYWLMEEVADLALSKVNKYVDEGKLWNANFEDAVLYVREAKAAKVSVEKGYGCIYVGITDGLDNEIYNMSLTVRLKNFGGWKAAKIVQGDTVQYALPVTDANGEVYLQFDVLPDAESATVTPIVPNEIPEDYNLN